MPRVLILLTLCFLLSCQKTSSDKTIITGQIINPNQNFLVLTDRENFSDTIFLDEKGEFTYELELLEEKIFHFKHSPEIQLIYLKPNDSITLHLNTIDFDGSLAFGGDSSRENNLLINLFLDFSKDHDILFKHHQYDVNNFFSTSDSIQNTYLDLVREKNKNRLWSDFFISYVENSIQYHIHNLNENFIFLSKREANKFEDVEQQMIDSQREQYDFNSGNSYWDLSYLKFLDTYSKNLAIDECIYREVESSICQRINTVEHLISRRNVVAEIISNPFLKKYLMKRFLTLEITYADTNEKIENALDASNQYDLLQSDVEFLQRLAGFHEKFVVGNTVSKVEFNDVLGDIKTLEPHLDKPTIVHTWSAYSDSNIKRRLPRMNRLRTNYPDIDIIGLNIDYKQHRLWRSKVIEYELNPELELQVQPNPEYEDLYIYYINKLFFICPTGKVRDRKLLIFDDQIESSILELINNNHTYM